MRTSRTLPILLAALLAGCGGSSSSSSVAKSKGMATLKIVWPERGRLIPKAANSLVVTLSQGDTLLSSKTIARPTAGSSTTQTTFHDLPVGSLIVSVKAFPNADGTGTAQGEGGGTLDTSTANPLITVSLTSTVASLVLTPTSTSFKPGATTSVTASGRDANGAIVLLSAGGGQESLSWSSSVPATATVNGTGRTAVVTGVAIGSTSISARMIVSDSGSTVTGSTALTVMGTNPLADSSWPCEGQNAMHTGRIGSPSAIAGTKLWEFDVPGTLPDVYGALAIGPDGTVYANAVDDNNLGSAGKLYALDGQTGAQKWAVATNQGGIFGSPSVGPDGTVYVCEGFQLIAFDGQTGARRWVYIASASLSETVPTVGANGLIYVGESLQAGHVYAVKASDGTLQWSYDTGGYVRASIALGYDGSAYVPVSGGTTSKMVALDAATGVKRWEFATTSGDNQMLNVAAVAPDNTIYFAGSQRLYALDGSTGSQKWVFNPPISNIGFGWNPTIAADGTLLVPCGVYNLFGLDATTGASKWQIAAGGNFTTASLDASGTAYITSLDERVYAVDVATGTSTWTYTAFTGSSNDANIRGQAAIASDGTLYFATTGGKVIALR